MSTRTTLEFLKTESGSGVLLAIAAALAIGWANTPFAPGYFALIQYPVTMQVGGFAETLSVAQWVKSGLMAIFFFVVGLEIKYEVLRGELSNPRRLGLPVLATLGGVVVPAAIYLAFNARDGGHPMGWAIPTPTDIAFALAVLAIAGPRLPPSLRILLLTLAIAQDMVSVLLIGVLYTADLHPGMLAGALATVGVMAAASRWFRAPYAFYAAAMVLAWGFTLKSGISTSLAGVAAALTIPLETRRSGGPGMLHEMMQALHPYVAFLILPAFAFVAAGFSVAGTGPASAFAPVPLGVMLGLVLGKPIGVFGAVALAIGLKLARRPTGARWIELCGVSVLCGVGFTMSLFIGALAFEANSQLQGQARLGAVAGSTLCMLLGGGLLAWAQHRRPAQ